MFFRSTCHVTTLVGSLGVIIFRSCDQEVKKKHIGDKREDDGGKGNAFDEEDNGLSRSKSGRSQRDLVTVQITNRHFGPGSLQLEA